VDFVAMLTPKIIKNKEKYAEAIAEIDRLMDHAPLVGSAEAEQLELLSLLVQNYEADEFPKELPDPLDAILFRMEQQELTPRDLIPYIGSRSKVSEVLTRKRSLTLSMIRALHDGLGIPASVLIRGSEELPLVEEESDWSRFPLREMMARNWVGDSIDSVKAFFSTTPEMGKSAILLRAAQNIRSARKMDRFALQAWSTRVVHVATKTERLQKYRPHCVGLEFMRSLAKCSALPDGPKAAQEFLREHGIAMVVEPHLPRTYLDGAAILIWATKPIIGLSLRHDRLDNFWFTLMHELAHIALHSGTGAVEFIDDLDIENTDDPNEQEADHLAGEALIPEAVWRKSPASRLRSPEAASHLAKQLGIHPAIVAGRMRHEWKAFRLLNNLVGHHDVRKQFPEIEWPD
jgi:HTH-type transcriptional regulator / antitoxin HigA